MKVKIGDTVYDAEIEPIMLILTPQDKLNIRNMLPEATLFCSFPDNIDTQEIKKFMKIESTESRILTFREKNQIMIIKTVNTNQILEVENFKGEINEPYIFSLNNKDWYYQERWKGSPITLLESKIIRKSIKKVIISKSTN